MSTVGVARALGLTKEQTGRALLELVEDQWFDRKSIRIDARGLADREIGFANAEGGTIVVGLHNGAVEGIRGNEKHLNGLRQATADFSVPPVRARYRQVECVNDKGQDDELLVIDIDPSERVHANIKDEVFLRIGDENRKLTFLQRQELAYDKGQASFEVSVVEDARLDELNRELLDRYAEALEHPDPVRLLVARGLMTARKKLTVGSLLLFGKQPQRRYPEASVRVTRYRGAQRGAGARQQLIDDMRCEGAIPVALGTAQQYVYDWIPRRRALGADGRFADVGMIPRDAWLEGLVNAVVHRSYSMMGDHIRVEIFDDRIEIESPGRFPGLVDPGDPESITRFARNPRIARVCADLRFGQELGEGIRRIFEEMRLAGLSDPVYRQTSGSVRLTLSSTPVDRALEARLPLDARELVRLIRDNERPSTGELASAIGLSRPATIARLRSLQELGLVEWVGNSAKDPRAYWRLPES